MPLPGCLAMICSLIASSGCSSITSRLATPPGVSGNSGKGGLANSITIFEERRCHALAGAQVERHLRPAPGVDMGAQGDEGLGLARIRRDVALFQVAVTSWLPLTPWPYWPRTVSRAMSARPKRRSERSTFSFSSRTASGASEVGGSMATMHSSCSRWFWTMSRMAPVLS
jgi:hypothetical protein